MQGFVVFVPGANVGDEVKVRINEVRQRFATAEVVREQAPFTQGFGISSLIGGSFTEV